jgi:hypothetical protein
MRRVAFYDDGPLRALGFSLVARQARKILSMGGSRVPLTVRVTWREGAGWDKVKEVWNEGTVIGDYTIPVAERIPETVLADIRAHRGALRLKFRLKPAACCSAGTLSETAAAFPSFICPAATSLKRATDL